MCAHTSCEVCGCHPPSCRQYQEMLWEKKTRVKSTLLGVSMGASVPRSSLRLLLQKQRSREVTLWGGQPASGTLLQGTPLQGTEAPTAAARVPGREPPSQSKCPSAWSPLPYAAYQGCATQNLRQQVNYCHCCNCPVMRLPGHSSMRRIWYNLPRH